MAPSTHAYVKIRGTKRHDWREIRKLTSRPEIASTDKFIETRWIVPTQAEVGSWRPGSPSYPALALQSIKDTNDLLVPFKAREMEISLLTKFLEYTPIHKKSNRRFEEAFPELRGVVASSDGQIPLEEVLKRVIASGPPARKAKLKDAREGDQQPVEIYGLKIPSLDVLRFGALLTLVLQGYFWLHLRQLASTVREQDKGWNTAWIGCYSGMPARASFLLSTSVPPLASVVLSIYRMFELYGGFSWIVRLVYSSSIILSVALVLGVVGASRRLWARVPRDPAS